MTRVPRDKQHRFELDAISEGNPRGLYRCKYCARIAGTKNVNTRCDAR